MDQNPKEKALRMKVFEKLDSLSERPKRTQSDGPKSEGKGVKNESF